jgi:hypothetical protein
LKDIPFFTGIISFVTDNTSVKRTYADFYSENVFPLSQDVLT